MRDCADVGACVGEMGGRYSFQRIRASRIGLALLHQDWHGTGSAVVCKGDWWSESDA